MKSCTITLTLLLLTACGPTVQYEPPPKMGKLSNCAAINREYVKTEQWLKEVRHRRSLITTDDVVGFIADFGAANYYAGSDTEQYGINRLNILKAAADEKSCTIARVGE